MADIFPAWGSWMLERGLVFGPQHHISPTRLKSEVTHIPNQLLGCPLFPFTRSFFVAPGHFAPFESLWGVGTL